VRSTHAFTAYRWGHKWVVLSVLVRLPFTHRPWALPVLVALYRSAADDLQAGRRHKTPQHWLRQLCCVLLRWFRQRQFVLAGDGGWRREVETVSGTGHWYKGGEGLVEVRWVFVHDLTGSHRDEYFFTTDVTLSVPEVIETYVSRWNEETTFQEMRSYLGLET